MSETHTHDWWVLRVAVPWRDEQFDPNVLAPERARHIDGTPHTDEEHAAKVAKPRAEVVFQCRDPECLHCHAVPIADDIYHDLVGRLSEGQLREEELGGIGLDELGVKFPSTKLRPRDPATVSQEEDGDA